MTVRPWPDGRFEILVGQRRYLACKLIQLDPVPCLVREGVSDADALSLSLIENFHRADMLRSTRRKPFRPSMIGTALTKGWRRNRHARSSPSDGTSSSSNCLSSSRTEIGTADGPSGISALSRLASTFEGTEAVTAYNEISGFTQRVQEEILKRSDGDLERLNDLVEEAQEGAFDIRRCGAASGCQLIRDIVKGRVSETEFGGMIREAERRMERHAPGQDKMQAAALAFWRTLTRVDN